MTPDAMAALIAAIVGGVAITIFCIKIILDEGIEYGRRKNERRKN